MRLIVALVECVSVLVVGVTAGASFPPIPVDLTTPTQQRIAIKGPNAVSIGWNTYKQLSKPCVQYGITRNKLGSSACSTSSVTYPNSRTWANTVILSGLSPGTTYYYKITSTNSTVEHFLSPRPAGDKGAFSFNAIIDLGVYGADGYTIAKDNAERDVIPSIDPSLNHTTIGRLASTIDDYEIVVHPGDLGYADDWIFSPKNLFDGVDAFSAIVEQFYGQLAPIAGRKPYMVGPGNHEANCQEIPLTQIFCVEGQKNFTDYMVRYGELMPATFASKSTDDAARAQANKAQLLAKPPFWYSFDYGMMHLVMINTETDFKSAPDGPGGSAGLNGGPFGTTATQQLDFLEADLASVDRSVTPWIVAGGHRPWYTTGDACIPCQEAFEPLLYKYGVDLAIFGHQHNSQRFQPVYRGVEDARGLQDPVAPMYIVAGGAGNIEGLTSVGFRQSYNAFAYAEDFSYARISFLDTNQLQVQFIRSTTGEILDQSVLYKSHSKRFVVQ
ncbi:Metallo-dependent phosphatase-like protein [Xylaria nigripes]|nr:Metallo-dependent phosphatase-like protein [Xylaria nigripes]